MIRVQNIYYMLSYAFRVLNEKGYRNMATEKFDNTMELCAAILLKGISLQLKLGLNREYIMCSEALSCLKGKIDISESIKTSTILKNQMVCSYDDYSVNSYKNQIIKTTVNLILRTDISSKLKKELRKQMVLFSDVETLDFHNINWKHQYNRNNQTYQMLISICYLVVKGLLQTNADGATRSMDFFDEQRMCRLYEKFILEFYRREFPMLNASASQIKWQLDDDYSFMLPTMQTDIMLSYENKTLIIDAKYYSHTTQVRFDKHKVHSNNLYQMFTYVKNKKTELSHMKTEVSGMVLYAKTDEQIHPDNEYMMSGSLMSVKTLDLDCDFEEIRNQLYSISIKYFGTLNTKVSL